MVRLKRVGQRNREEGYILLALLLFMALLAIAAAVAAPSIVFQFKRDQEEELVHRGIQYRRAVRLYVSKTGRYPSTPEALLGTADFRYIRKLYKDPITGGDFRLLHMGDVQPGVGLGTPIQANQNGGTGNSGDPSAQNTNGQPTSNQSAPDQQNSGSPSNQQADTGVSGTTASGFQASSTSSTLGSTSPASGASSTNIFGSSGQQPGLLIFGVASKSKDRTIREFNKKNHYNDWWFYYDQRALAGYEVKGPTPPATAMQNPMVPPGAPVGSAFPGFQNGPLQGGSPLGLQPNSPQQGGSQPPPQQPISQQ